MPLDPRAKRFLDMLALAAPADAAPPGIVERRRAFADLMRFSGPVGAVGGVEARTFPGPGGPVALRLYTPAAPATPTLPGLVYFHGGGLVAGSLETHDGLCRTLATETGCRLVAVDYRLAPEHTFPAALTDAGAATRWVFEQARQLAIDPERIGVGANSAGGTLAVAVCQMARRGQGLKLAFQLLLCPILDFGAQTQSRRSFGGPLLDEDMLRRDLAHYLPAGIDASDPRVSPLRAADVSGLPPAYVHTAEYDPLRDEGQAYADRLAAAGVEVKYTCHPGMIHLFYALAGVIPYARLALKSIGAEVRAALQAKLD